VYHIEHARNGFGLAFTREILPPRQSSVSLCAVFGWADECRKPERVTRFRLKEDVEAAARAYIALIGDRAVRGGGPMRLTKAFRLFGWLGSGISRAGRRAARGRTRPFPARG
jgi:hypothetical protein